MRERLLRPLLAPAEERPRCPRARPLRPSPNPATPVPSCRPPPELAEASGPDHQRCRGLAARRSRHLYPRVSRHQNLRRGVRRRAGARTAVLNALVQRRRPCCTRWASTSCWCYGSRPQVEEQLSTARHVESAVFARRCASHDARALESAKEARRRTCARTSRPRSARVCRTRRWRTRHISVVSGNFVTARPVGIRGWRRFPAYRAWCARSTATRSATSLSRRQGGAAVAAGLFAHRARRSTCRWKTSRRRRRQRAEGRQDHLPHAKSRRARRPGGQADDGNVAAHGRGTVARRQRAAAATPPIYLKHTGQARCKRRRGPRAHDPLFARRLGAARALPARWRQAPWCPTPNLESLREATLG